MVNFEFRTCRCHSLQVFLCYLLFSVFGMENKYIGRMDNSIKR
uniref:Uncharacterized protein n=1 Tax=Siphoviridae sp. ctr2f5 TaxID=2825684 RepID=A0A8S5QEQ0_9CAUD|nr:MAG TPA: hypothetical protein [Siphoviridae sp. ctr2f5]